MIELPVPWYIWFKKQPVSDISASHIPERFGLFTIIVLGESVVAAARGLTEQRWQPEAVATAAFGFLVAICVWWIYFDTWNVLSADSGSAQDSPTYTATSLS
jgi:low temperature requirement protein LtrA